MFNISYMDTKDGLIHQIARAPYILNSNGLEQFYNRVTADREKLYEAFVNVNDLPNIEAILPLLNYLNFGKTYEMIISKLDSSIYPIEHKFFNNADYVFLWQTAKMPKSKKNLKKLELGTLYPRRKNNNPNIKGIQVPLAEWKTSGVIFYTIGNNEETGTKDQMITKAYRHIYQKVTSSEYAKALLPKVEDFVIINGKHKRVKCIIKQSQIKFDNIFETYNDGIIQGFDWRVVNPNRYIRDNIELYCATCDRLGMLHNLNMYYVETKGAMCGPCRDYYIENNLITESMVHR